MFCACWLTLWVVFAFDYVRLHSFFEFEHVRLHLVENELGFDVHLGTSVSSFCDWEGWATRALRKRGAKNMELGHHCARMGQRRRQPRLNLESRQ